MSTEIDRTYDRKIRDIIYRECKNRDRENFTKELSELLQEPGKVINPEYFLKTTIEYKHPYYLELLINDKRFSSDLIEDKANLLEYKMGIGYNGRPMHPCRKCLLILLSKPDMIPADKEEIDKIMMKYIYYGFDDGVRILSQYLDLSTDNYKYIRLAIERALVSTTSLLLELSPPPSCIIDEFVRRVTVLSTPKKRRSRCKRCHKRRRRVKHYRRYKKIIKLLKFSKEEHIHSEHEQTDTTRSE